VPICVDIQPFIILRYLCKQKQLREMTHTHLLQAIVEGFLRANIRVLNPFKTRAVEALFYLMFPMSEILLLFGNFPSFTHLSFC